MIKINNLYKSFGKNVVFRGLNLEIRDGKTITIIGGSGCGKSVLIKHIVGLLKPDSGEIFIDDKEITKLKEDELFEIQKKFGFVFGLVLAALLAISLGGCATGKSAEQSEPEKAQAPAAVVTPLSRGYSDIFVFEMDASQALKNPQEAVKHTKEGTVFS